MASEATVIQFTVHPDDAGLLQEMIQTYGNGDPDRFLREAVRILAAARRADRLDATRQQIATELGRTFSTQEIVEMSKSRALPGEPRIRPRRNQEG